MLIGFAVASAGGDLALPAWSAAPFASLLLTIGILPLLAPKFWHSNRNKAFVAALFAAPVVAYLLWVGPATGGRSVLELRGGLRQYFSFILLLASLYTVSGGILILGALEGKPSTNTLLLLAGVVLANAIGTTGASMLLVRPFLRENRERRSTGHLPVFFIFLVSNLGGLLTPLGDPPLFLGFIAGVPFAWTLGLWQPWLAANGIVLTVFYLWDAAAYRRESPADHLRERLAVEPLRVRGGVNFLFLAGIVAGVLLQSESVAAAVAARLPAAVAEGPLAPSPLWGEALMLFMGVLSLSLTPQAVRRANEFSWGAIVEVAVVFAGIFATMVPALVILRESGDKWGVTEPWHYFWLSGALSSFLDNAPTYLTFASMAAGPHDFAWLAEHRPLVLQAVSCGAVFMGANTYIGNGPNLMVKAIADESGVKAPSFFGYMAYSGVVLLPTFLLITLLFFR